MDAKLRYGAGFACGKCGTSASDAATGSQPIQTPCSLLSTPMQFLSSWNKEMRLPQEGCGCIVSGIWGQVTYLGDLAKDK